MARLISLILSVAGTFLSAYLNEKYSIITDWWMLPLQAWLMMFIVVGITTAVVGPFWRD